MQRPGTNMGSTFLLLTQPNGFHSYDVKLNCSCILCSLCSMLRIKSSGVLFEAGCVFCRNSCKIVIIYTIILQTFSYHLLVKAMRGNHSIQTLLLEECLITSKGIESLADVLKTDHTLLSLVLSHNDIGDTGANLIGTRRVCM